ncbi:hypothetical protein D3C71_1696960 [compost metagenome]
MRRIFRRQHEAGLRIIEFTRDALHLRGFQPLGVQHNRQRVAAIGLGGEDIGGDVSVAHASFSLSEGKVAVCKGAATARQAQNGRTFAITARHGARVE